MELRSSSLDPCCQATTISRSASSRSSRSSDGTGSACAFSGALASIVLVVIWAISEYNNAGGWPTGGFGQSSGIPNVWNDWIVYPLLLVGLAVAIDAWNTFRHKPITEGEIRREIDRLRGEH